MLLDRKVFGRLEDGKYTVILVSYEEVEGKEGKANFLKLYFRFENGRELTEAVFESGLNIMSNELHTQFDAPAGVSLDQLLTLASEGSVDIWVSHNTVGSRTYRNINFQPSYTPASSSSSDSEEEIPSF